MLREVTLVLLFVRRGKKIYSPKWIAYRKLHLNLQVKKIFKVLFMENIVHLPLLSFMCIIYSLTWRSLLGWKNFSWSIQTLILLSGIYPAEGPGKCQKFGFSGWNFFCFLLCLYERSYSTCCTFFIVVFLHLFLI